MRNDSLIPEDRRKYDYRSNLIVDENNPILIQKAWRDHFSGDSYWKKGKDGGKAYLGVKHGEDAMTWNVFRSLQKEGPIGYQIMAEVLGLFGVEKVLFWGCDAESPGDEQQLLSILIRTVDGRLKGTMTEPDLVLISPEEVAFVECKLNLSGSQSPWRAQRGNSGQKSGAEKRMEIYIRTCGFHKLAEVENWREIYQLLRQYVYASLLAKALKKKPVVIPLINKDHKGVLSQFYDNDHINRVLESDVFYEMATWQAFLEPISRLGSICWEKLKKQMLAAFAASKKYKKESELDRSGPENS